MSENASPTFHVNHVQAHGNGFDVALDLSYRAKTDEESRPPLLRVTMSWEHLQAMVPVLERLIEEYERTVGPLPRVDEAAARAEAGAAQS